MRIYIYMINNPAEFHPDPIWNDGAIGFFEDGRNVRQLPECTMDQELET